MSKVKNRPKADVISPSLGEIDKVRDILFGKYVSDFEHRFAQLESRLEKDVDQLKDRLTKKVESMDVAFNESLTRLDKVINDEQTKRDSEVSELHATLDEARKGLQHSISLMEDQTSQDLAAVRKSLQQSHDELLDQAQAIQAKLGAELKAHSQEMQTDKVSRQTLALMLDEVAVKLRSEQ